VPSLIWNAGNRPDHCLSFLRWLLQALSGKIRLSGWASKGELILEANFIQLQVLLSTLVAYFLVPSSLSV